MAKQSFLDSIGGTGGLVGMGLGLLPTAIKAFTAGAQKRRAQNIETTDPGFVANPELLNNQRVVNQMYNNYTLPGMDGIISRRNAGVAGQIAGITQAAGSGTDVLDGISKIGYQEMQGNNALGIAEAEQKQNMLPMVLDANAAAGNELVRKNIYDQQEYQRLSAEKADLLGASAQNSFNAVDDAATLGGTLLNYKVQPWRKGKLNNFNQLPSQFN